MSKCLHNKQIIYFSDNPKKPRRETKNIITAALTMALDQSINEISKCHRSLVMFFSWGIRVASKCLNYYQREMALATSPSSQREKFDN